MGVIGEFIDMMNESLFGFGSSAKGKEKTRVYSEDAQLVWILLVVVAFLNILTGMLFGPLVVLLVVLLPLYYLPTIIGLFFLNLYHADKTTHISLPYIFTECSLTILTKKYYTVFLSSKQSSSKPKSTIKMGGLGGCFSIYLSY